MEERDGVDLTVGSLLAGWEVEARWVIDEDEAASFLFVRTASVF